MKTSWIAGLFLFIAVLFLSGLQDSFFQAFLSLSLLVLLCMTALPVSRFLFTDPLDARIMAFPIGFVVHAVILALAGLIIGIQRSTIGAYLILAPLLSAYFLYRSRRFSNKNPNGAA